MSETPEQDLSGLPETPLATLYLRAMESLRPDALFTDEKAVALVTSMGYDFARVREIPMSELNACCLSCATGNLTTARRIP